MPTMTISLDGMVLKDIALTQPRTTLGRRSYNDIVIDNLAVSGEHAVFVLKPEGVELIDLNSTNGSYVNGKAVVAALLKPDDVIEIGPYRMLMAQEPQEEAVSTSPAPAQARIRVLSAAAAGKEIALTKSITTLGKKGIAVAAIRKSAAGVHTFSLIEGQTQPLVNGQPVGKEPVALYCNDVISVAGIEMQFLC